MTTNVVTAAFGASKIVRTRALYQWDYGQVLQFAGLDLPDAYTVHFSNQGIGGTAKTQVGNADGVDIPDEYLTSGQAVYAWVYLHAGDADGETVYAVIIPVTARPRPTEEEPTPVQQGAIDQAIAALNAGVQDVQEAVEGVQDAIDTALQEAKSSGEFDGEDGVSPTVDVTEITGGHRVSITDAEGTEAFDVMNGVDGEDGEDGVSPTATVTQTSTGATITVTDAQGTTTADIANGRNGAPGAPGTDGADGVSPTITVTDITGGHRVTITDATGPHSFDVMDGTGGVQDVQVNGTSVVTDGVANVPIGGANLGVLKPRGNAYGINQVSGSLYLVKAAGNEIKSGDGDYKPIVTSSQHAATFYGLAKAAGDTTQSASSNPVGTYTESAKSAIKNMLGVGETVTLREWAELGEDMELIEIPLPEKYSRIYVRFMARINNSENNLANANAQSIIWLGDDTNFGVVQQDYCVYYNTYIRASDIYMAKARFDVNFPYIERYCTNSYGATNWSANSNWQSTGGSYNDSTNGNLTAYPRFLLMRPYDISKGYLYKSNSKLCVYAVL